MKYVPIEVTLAIKDLHLSDKSLNADDVRVKYLTKQQLKEFAGIRETLPHIRMKEFHDMFMFSFYACGLRLIVELDGETGHYYPVDEEGMLKAAEEYY